MKILHVFKSGSEKFSEPYIDFINNNFNAKEHSFIIHGPDKGVTKKNRDNVKFIKGRQYIDFTQELYKADKIMLHALLSPIVVMILWAQPWLLKKCYWCVWGGDLYYYSLRKKKTINEIYETMRRIVIKRMGGIITHIKGDYELAKRWYSTRGEHYYCFMYPSNLFREYPFEEFHKTKDKIVIQVGNSADSTNNHIEVLDKLSKYRELDIEIICPLSYGNEGYKEKVIEHGKQIFGDKFYAITNFLQFSEYLKILAKIDVAIFNHKRQQGVGNITALLGFGKKVYIRDEITTYEFCTDHDLKVYSSNGDFEDLFEPMEEHEQERNIENIKKQFSKEKLKKDWNIIFEA